MRAARESSEGEQRGRERSDITFDTYICKLHFLVCFIACGGYYIINLAVGEKGMEANTARH